VVGAGGGKVRTASDCVVIASATGTPPLASARDIDLRRVVGTEDEPVQVLDRLQCPSLRFGRGRV
jgi:hypothetical protein